MKTKNIRQVITFKSTPHDVYEQIMDAKKHAKFSGTKAKITRKVGAKFTVYGGWVQGKNLKLVPDKLIVQEWRGNSWPKGHHSIATFRFAKKKSGTTLTFSQTHIPADEASHINKGWKAQYWDKMKVALGEKKQGKKEAAM